MINSLLLAQSKDSLSTSTPVTSKNSVNKKTKKTPSATATQSTSQGKKSLDSLPQNLDITNCPEGASTSQNTSQASPSPCTLPSTTGDHFYQYSVTPSKTRVLSKYGTPKRTALDHAYSSLSKKPCAKVQRAAVDVPLTSPCSSQESQRTLDSSQLSAVFEYPESDMSDVAPLSDVSYTPSDLNADSDSEAECGQPLEDRCEKQDRMTNENKYIVYKDNLEQLMKFCMRCGSPIIEKIPSENGSMISYKISCHEGHKYTWDAQPCVGKKPLGNAALSAAILVTGNTYSRIADFAAAFNLLFFSHTVYHKYQRDTLIPVIQQEWEKECQNAVDEVKDTPELVLAGDARCDSPGHVSKYGSYTLMHATGNGSTGTRKIVAMEMVQVSEVKNSNHMEPEGLKRCLNYVKEDLKIGTLATDRHLMVGAMMRTDFPQIDHQFDLWHFCKSILKKITAKAKLKGCEELGSWTQSIANHLWWCAATCNGSAPLLKEKWMSLLHHITNNHKWVGNTVFHKCDHARLTAKQKAKTKWLKSTSDAFKALQAIVTDKRLLKALPHITKFCHTGDLEIFHSMLLKYCSKRQHFQYDAMKARLMLAALDWNTQSREVVKDDDGNNKEKLVYSKRRKQWVLKCRYINRNMQHVPHVMQRALEAEIQGLSVPTMKRPKDLPAHVAAVPKPDKTTMNKMSRFSVM